MLKEEYSNFSGFGNINNIIGVGIGRKHDAFVINIYAEIEDTYNTNFIIENYHIHQNIEINIKAIGRIKSFQRIYRRPAFPGCSVGHYNITAGTLGCFVRNQTGVYVLSNNHVLADTNNATIGDVIIQPGRLDGGTIPIGRLSNFVPIDFVNDNIMDAAIARVAPRDASPAVPRIGNIRGVMNPFNGMLVEKLGRTTGYRRGIIEDIAADIMVDYDGQTAMFVNQIKITSTIPGYLFSTGGDSGSIIINQANKNAVGLLFAGNNDTNTTFANPIIPVLEAFNVQIFSYWRPRF